MMIDDDGKLKKQYVTVGVSTDGYSVPVKAGYLLKIRLLFLMERCQRRGEDAGRNNR